MSAAVQSGSGESCAEVRVVTCTVPTIVQATALEQCVEEAAALLTRGASEPTPIVIFPEYAFDATDAAEQKTFVAAAQRAAARFAVMLVICLPLRCSEGDGDAGRSADEGSYNTAIVIGPDGREVARHAKRTLAIEEWTASNPHRFRKGPSDTATAVPLPESWRSAGIDVDLRVCVCADVANAGLMQRTITTATAAAAAAMLLLAPVYMERTFHLSRERTQLEALRASGLHVRALTDDLNRTIGTAAAAAPAQAAEVKQPPATAVVIGCARLLAVLVDQPFVQRIDREGLRCTSLGCTSVIAVQSGGDSPRYRLTQWVPPSSIDRNFTVATVRLPLRSGRSAVRGPFRPVVRSVTHVPGSSPVVNACDCVYAAVAAEAERQDRARGQQQQKERSFEPPTPLLAWAVAIGVLIVAVVLFRVLY